MHKHTGFSRHSCVRTVCATLFCAAVALLAGCGGGSGATSSSPTSPNLQSIAITPGTASVVQAASVQLKATAMMSDGSSQDVTALASWSSLNTANATVGASTGKVAGIAVGGASISASYQGRSATATVTVTGHAYQQLHAFAGYPSEGAFPGYGSLIQGSDGNFYGMTQQGGASNKGTIFEVTPAGAKTVLHSFQSGADGANPYGGLIQGGDGNFYGLTETGGTSNNGTVFKVTPAGVETVLYSFQGGPTDGGSPQGNLIQGSDGNFYGLTEIGGASGNGTIFRY